MSKELAKAYEPKEVEDRIYDFWMKGKYFHAEVDPKKKPYTIVIPPPNITGQLHLGHAMDETLQDTLIRWRRMQGYSALWLPGTDHASIATEAKIVEAMRKEGITKEEIGREKFLERAWAWKDQYGGRIVEQLKKLGSSCDWDRLRFTMDEGCNKAVNHVFKKLYDKGLIYRGERIINWCPHCKTSISDAEVVFEEKEGSFWHLRYPLSDGSGYIELATTRPETMLGDTAVAVHPDDERYKALVGKTVILPLVNKEIPIIADSYVEQDFGTGVVKITPAHDPNDFEVGLRHNLPVINENGGIYAGMSALEARKQIVKDLDEAGFLIKIEPIKHNVGTCYRCGTVVEPRVSTQWFVKMEPLAKPAIDAVKDGDIRFIPERMDKVYYNWMENIKDWCISRQLWWGHQIPAWYCECGETIVSETVPTVCPKCGGTHLTRDPDTLDTWFSSALWPFSTLGWPEETEDLKYFYPTDVLVTGYDIIFFWVVRMVFSALETTGEVPFHHVYVHGLVRDAQGRKMSKSLGNGIDPLEIIDQYGADALRFMLTTGITPGNDMRFKTDKLESARNFANKLWNASRFVIMNLQDEDGNFRQMADLTDLDKAALQDEDKWIISRVNDATKYITETMEKYDLALAGQRAYDLIWNEFCDWYIEIVKGRLYGDDEEDKKVARAVLVKVLKDMLRLLHPFMPYITEEIWTYLPKGEVDADNPKGFLIKEHWPVYSEDLCFPQEAEKLEMAMNIIKSIRNIRAEADAAPSKALRAVILCGEGRENVVKAGERYIKKLANITEISFIASKADVPEEVMSAVVPGAEIFIPLDDIMDYEAELDRLQKEKKKLEGEVKRVKGKLSNEGFVSKAPQKVVEEEKAKQVKYEEMLAKVCDRLAIVEKKVK